MERKKILTGKMSLDLKKRMIKCVVWSVTLYAVENWTISKTDIKRIEAFELWLWRRMEKISWTAKVSNSEVMSRVMEDRCIVDTIKQRKRKWLGHVLLHDVLLRDILESGTLGKRTWGRKRLQLISNICERTSYESVKKWAEDRCQWRVLDWHSTLSASPGPHRMTYCPDVVAWFRVGSHWLLFYVHLSNELGKQFQWLWHDSIINIVLTISVIIIIIIYVKNCSVYRNTVRVTLSLEI